MMTFMKVLPFALLVADLTLPSRALCLTLISLQCGSWRCLRDAHGENNASVHALLPAATSPKRLRMVGISLQQPINSLPKNSDHVRYLVKQKSIA